MKRIKSIGVAVCLLAAVLAAPAAAQPEAVVTRSFYVKAKSGMEADFEQGFKAHLDWHKQQKDTWSWQTYQYETGERIGSYVIVTGGHRWEDFDARGEMGEADLANYRATAGQFAEVTGSVLSIARLEVSRPLADPTPTPLISAIYFHLKPGGGDDFNYCIRKFHEAIGKTNWPVNYFWLQRVAGGEVATYILLLPRKNWAAFKPGEKSFDAMLEEAFGPVEARALLEKFSKSIAHESAEVLRHRPDLSYTPPM